MDKSDTVLCVSENDFVYSLVGLISFDHGITSLGLLLAIDENVIVSRFVVGYNVFVSCSFPVTSDDNCSVTVNVRGHAGATARPSLC